MAQSRQSEKLQMNLFGKSSDAENCVIAFMPIKPIYARKLMSGEKKYEFRKSPINIDLSHIIIYASSPVKKVIGLAEVKRVLVTSPSAVWSQTKHAAGIAKKAYEDYFAGKKQAYAIEIKKIVHLAKEIAPVELENGFKVPQSFSYVDTKFYLKVAKKGGLDANER